VTDLVSAIAETITAAAAIVALVFAWLQVTQASDVRDLEFLNNQRELIGEHWRKTRLAYSNNPTDGKFEFGELLDCYERTCFTLNKLKIGPRTYHFFRDHILEVILNISKDEFLWKELQELKSGPRTYSEMQKFIDNNKVHLKEIERSRLSILTQ